MSTNIFKGVLFIGLLVYFVSCKKDDNDSTKPEVTGLEIGLGDSRECHRGGDVHLEFEVTDNEELGYYSIEIYKEMKGASSIWNYESRWDFEPGLRNALVHSHRIEIPEDADLGIYSFNLTIADKAGNQLIFDEEVTMLEASTGDGPEIHVEVHPDTGEAFNTGQSITISGHVHSETAHIAGLYIGIVSESAGLADTLVNATNSIVLFHEHDFELYEVEFSPSIVVGAAEDNNHPVPNPISSWSLGDAYILIKTVDEAGNWSYSEHYSIVINGK